jgi:acetolactate synthase-1/3 small subunit
MIIDMTGAPSKVQNFIDVMKPFGIKEMMRTGRIAMVRGPRTHMPVETAADVVEDNGHLVETLN